MSRPSIQSPSAVVMVRPHYFTVNTETAADNAFQVNGNLQSDDREQAYAEHGRMVDALRGEGVEVHLFEGRDPDAPDCVFPNNWFSTHAGGYVAVYPMKARNRRRERRQDVLEMLKTRYRVQEIIDYSGLEADGLYLEGTGAMVLDHIGRVAYAVDSERTSPIALERFCTHFNYEPMVFSAQDSQGRAIYHTNVLMCIGTSFALIGEELIPDPERRKEVVMRLREGGRQVVSLASEQIAAFAGNAIELMGREGPLLALSQTAHDALSQAQRDVISGHARLVALPIPTIERAGGSVRCAIAGVHLSPRPL